MIQLLLLVALAQPVPTVPGIPSPTPVPSVTPAPTQLLLDLDPAFNFMATAQANANALPDDIMQPGGFAAVPAENGQQLFSYIKWLFAPNTSSELFGRHLGQIVPWLLTFLVVTVIVLLIYFVIRAIVALVKPVLAVVRIIGGLK
jgi:hypothetical protein